MNENIVLIYLFLFPRSLTNASEEGVDSPPAGLTPIVVGHRTPQMSATMEHEKRLRREIANSNERRRMQSINAGFQNLRTLIPHHEGEKLSKVRIAHYHQSTYVYDNRNNYIETNRRTLLQYHI
jgi:transcription factor AP-4